VSRILARVFAYLPFFISQILDFIYWTILILILIYFEWRDTENQQLQGNCRSPCIQLNDWQLGQFPCSKKSFLAVVSGTWSSSLDMSLLLILATFVKISRASSLRPFTSDSGIKLRTIFRLVFADIPLKEPRAVNKSTSFPGCLSSALPGKAEGREPGNEAASKWVKNERVL